MPTKLSDLKPLRKRFAIFSRRGYWSIECFDCNWKFIVEKRRDWDTVNLSNLQTALRHAATHPQAPPPVEEPIEDQIEIQPTGPQMAPAEFRLLRKPREELF